MRHHTHANLNCIETGFGFGRNVIGGMGDALRLDDAFATRLYRAQTSAPAAKPVAVERDVLSGLCQRVALPAYQYADCAAMPAAKLAPCGTNRVPRFLMDRLSRG